MITNPNFNPGVQELLIRSTDSEKREITAIGVPYNQVINVFDYDAGYCKEQFARGSIDATDAILRYGHYEPIGRIISARDSEEGLEITAVISKTQRGDEVWQLIKDHVLTRMSIGFIGLEKNISKDDGENTLITWTKVKAQEFSVVEFPAYSEAKITGARNIENTLKETVKDKQKMDTNELTELKDRVEVVERSLATAVAKPAPQSAPSYRSYGEYILSAMRSEETASEFHSRNVQDSSKVVGKNPWLGVLNDRMRAKQPVINLFNHTLLPSKGMTLDYVTRGEASTIKTGRQQNEGDKLATGALGTWKAEAVPVHTYGGTVDNVTRQLIERATDVNVLDEIFSDLAFAYATDLEKDFKTLFENTYTSQVSAPTVETNKTLNDMRVADFFDVFEDLADAYDDTPFTMDAVAVSPEVFRHLRNLVQTPTAFQAGGAPENKVGIYKGPSTGTLVLHDGTVIKRIRNWAGAHMTGINARALTLAEEAGAPTRLQDERINSLTKDFAVYGYAAMYAPRPHLIKPVKFNS